MSAEVIQMRSTRVGHGSQFGRKKEAAIAALLTQRSIEEAARVAGISIQTMYRWMKEPEFQVEFRRARQDAFSQSIARLQQAAGAAVSTLLKLMVDPATPAPTRAYAANSVLLHSRRSMEIDDIQARLDAMEKALLVVRPAGNYGGR
jgi:hypothetical protein